jgi:hypothetical protein
LIITIGVGLFNDDGLSLVNNLPLLALFVDNLLLGCCGLLEYLANCIQEFALALVLANLGAKSCFLFLLGTDVSHGSIFTVFGFFQVAFGSLLFRLVNLTFWNEFSWLS